MRWVRKWTKVYREHAFGIENQRQLYFLFIVSRPLLVLTGPESLGGLNKRGGKTFGWQRCGVDEEQEKRDMAAARRSIADMIEFFFVYLPKLFVLHSHKISVRN